MNAYMHPLALVQELKSIGNELFHFVDQLQLAPIQRRWVRRRAKRFAELVDEPLPPSIVMMGRF